MDRETHIILDDVVSDIVGKDVQILHGIEMGIASGRSFNTWSMHNINQAEKLSLM